MKRLNTISPPVFFLLIFFVSCQHEENLLPIKGKITFSLVQQTPIGWRERETTTPAFVLLTITNSKGNVQENIKLALYDLGQDYVSENLELQTGNYLLTQFVVLDASNKIIYETPQEESGLAQYVADPLPIEFAVSAEGTQVAPQVLVVLENDRPELVLIKVALKINVSGVLYENLDALIRVSGYSSDNTKQWMKDYNFIGPEDSLEVRNGFHHYSVELVDKWGINAIQSDISGKEMWEGRLNGPLPVTYELIGLKSAKKLRSYVTSFEVNIPGTDVFYQPNFKVLYKYNSEGRLQYSHLETYNPQTSQFEESTVDAFTYEGTKVSKIVRTLHGQPYQEYNYTYGTEDKIVAAFIFGFVTTQTTKRNYEAGLGNGNVTVNYSSSNGQSFLYEFDTKFGNAISDRTVRADELCEEGSYTYDKYINPFKHLGYIDFDLQNESPNNRLTENVDYKACSFPSNIPLSYTYTYDQEGYPVTKITTYKSSFNKPYHSKTEFFYE